MNPENQKILTKWEKIDKIGEKGSENLKLSSDVSNEILD